MNAKREFNSFWSLFTLCPLFVMFLSVWNLRTVMWGGGGLCLLGHLIRCVLQGRWEEKEHNWIKYQNKVSVCFNHPGDTGSSWNRRVKGAWRERKREKGEERESKREGEGEKERQRGQPGWVVPRLWLDNETRGWRGSCLGGGWPFRVHCQVSKPRGQWSLPLSQHSTNMLCSWLVFHTTPINHWTKRLWRTVHPWNWWFICWRRFRSTKTIALLVLC